MSVNNTQEAFTEEEAFDFMYECYIDHVRGRLAPWQRLLMRGAIRSWMRHVETEIGINTFAEQRRFKRLVNRLDPSLTAVQICEIIENMI